MKVMVSRELVIDVLEIAQAHYAALMLRAQSSSDAEIAMLAKEISAVVYNIERLKSIIMEVEQCSR